MELELELKLELELELESESPASVSILLSPPSSMLTTRHGAGEGTSQKETQGNVASCYVPEPGTGGGMFQSKAKERGHIPERGRERACPRGGREECEREGAASHWHCVTEEE